MNRHDYTTKSEIYPPYKLPPLRFKGHKSGVTSAVFSPDGQILATGSADKTARLWDVASGQATAKLEVLIYIHIPLFLALVKITHDNGH